MSDEHADSSAPVEDFFPRTDFLELLRQARKMLAGADRQHDLLEDLRIPARLVLGGSATAGPAHDSASSTSARTAITSPALPDRIADRTAPAGNRLRSATFKGTGWALSSRRHPVRCPRSAPCRWRNRGSGRPSSRAVSVRQFAEKLLDVVATPEHHDAGVLLARRAQSELPTADQNYWGAVLIPQLQACRSRPDVGPSREGRHLI